MTGGIPFQERKTPWRGLLDLATGRYPRFLFGGGVGSCLPVFHFHEATVEGLEPYLSRLADNGYCTVTSEAVADYVLRGVHPGKNRVMLCFDDAWASLWTVAAPLLRRHGLTAVTFAIVGRIRDGHNVRPRLGETGFDPDVDHSATPYCTWPELRAMREAGTIDVQAHTWDHAKIFCDPLVTGFITPDFAAHPHDAPLVPGEDGTGRRLLSGDDLGAPLHVLRSAMSDALEYDDFAARQACTSLVRARGGTKFFDRPDWERQLRETASRHPGRLETEAQRDKRILEELVLAREQLNLSLGGDETRQMCFPWAIAGKRAAKLAARAGYATAFADRLFGYRAVRAGDPPFRLMRLRHELIFCLPGQNRRAFWQVRRAKMRMPTGET